LPVEKVEKAHRHAFGLGIQVDAFHDAQHHECMEGFHEQLNVLLGRLHREQIEGAVVNRPPLGPLRGVEQEVEPDPKLRVRQRPKLAIEPRLGIQFDVRQRHDAVSSGLNGGEAEAPVETLARGFFASPRSFVGMVRGD
jgi:hypothetical protein